MGAGPLVSCNNFPFWVGHHHTMIDAVSHYVGASAVSSHCGVSDGVLNTFTGKLDCAAATSEYNATSVAAAAAHSSTNQEAVIGAGSVRTGRSTTEDGAMRPAPSVQDHSPPDA